MNNLVLVIFNVKLNKWDATNIIKFEFNLEDVFSYDEWVGEYKDIRVEDEVFKVEVVKNVIPLNKVDDFVML